MTILREYKEFLLPEPRIHKQKTNIHHWQLRDLISCPTISREIIAVDQKSVCRYDTVSEKSSQIFKSLSFTPVSLSAGYNYVAAGGQRSQVVVKSLNSSWSHETTSGRYVNNSVCISKSWGETRMLLCNNDETVRVFSIPTMQRLSTIKFNTAVNYATVSPDGRKLVVVGDSSRVYLYSITGGDYTRIRTFSTESGPGFCCCWNHLSERFAVASQDGSVSVWDIRGSDRLAQLYSNQRSPYGACRAVKFALSGAVDLLAFSEHSTYVNIVDSRTFDVGQSIDVSSCGLDNNIAGIAFSPDGGTFFAAVGCTAILEYKVDFASRRRFSESSVT